MKTTAYIGDDTKVTVEFDYSPPCQGSKVWGNPNFGPDCDAELDITAVMLGEDDVLPDLNQDAITRLEVYCGEELAMLEISRQADHGDWLYEQMKDRRMGV